MARALQQRRPPLQLQPRQPDAKVEALLQARRQADQSVSAFEDLRKMCRRPPTVAVYESTKYAMFILAFLLHLLEAKALVKI